MNRSAVRISWLLLLGCLAVAPGAGAADAALASVAGNWLTEPHDGIIQVTIDAAGGMTGRIVGGNHPGLKDQHNPDAARRDLVLRGQVILKGMKYDGAGHWSGGTIYKPDNGKTYKCKVALSDTGVLEVRGFIGFTLFGITQEWTRYAGTSMDLPPAH